MAGKVVTSPVELREEGDRASGYSTRRLFSHFWRMILSSGTRALRFVSVLGSVFGIIGVLIAVFILIARLSGDEVPEGWASTIVVILLSTGAILFSLGVIAEYIGVNVNMAMGKPPYLITSDPQNGPLGRRRPDPTVTLRRMGGGRARTARPGDDGGPPTRPALARSTREPLPWP